MFEDVQFPIVDFVAPMRPTGLRASSSPIDAYSQRITVSWDKNTEADFAQFRLFIKTLDGNEVEIRTNDTSFQFESLNGVDHGLRLAAMDIMSNTSLSTERLHYRSGESPVAQSDDIFRFFNTETGVHFYTNSALERDHIILNIPQFSYEGNPFDAPFDGEGDVTVFRFYNTETNSHFFTSNIAERDSVITNLKAYSYEGEAYEGYSSGGVGREALFRFYNSETGTHFYTANEFERDEVAANLSQYHYEGIAYYIEV